jgi:hypothetical protein
VATYVSQTACDHPYFPLRPGASWTYTSGSGERTLTVSAVTGGTEAATATVVREDGEAVEWHCTAEGVWSYLLIIAAFGLDGETRGELTANSGAWLAPAEQLAPGAAWNFFFRLEPSAATGNVIVGFWEFTQAMTVAGVESVTLEGETVDALRVDATYDFAGEGAQTVSGRERYWFVEGVGLARLEHAAEQLQDTFVLQRYQVP